MLHMRIGIPTKWFNSGQAVVSRQLRTALDELGHETFVLARQGKGKRSQEADRPADPVWDQPGVTEVAEADVPLAEFERWIDGNGIEALFVDNSYQFEELRALRNRGVRIIGRFVWEHFAAEHVEPAREAFDVIYSVTRCEQERYRALGLETPYLPWGCHPELLALAEERRTDSDEVRLLFPGGTLNRRKPIAEVLEAFARVPDPRLRLVVKGQLPKRGGKIGESAREDSRLEVVLGDQPTAEHLRRTASCDVCLAPARWEGLGVPLFEALAFGQPTITNDDPPMNEVVADGVNGLLVGSHPDGTARSGITAFTPDVGDLAKAIERIADDGERRRLAEGAIRVRDTERRWEHTVAGIADLVEQVR
jgi:glycosyltransferase involved in cell wall biosynthesis